MVAYSLFGGLARGGLHPSDRRLRRGRRIFGRPADLDHVLIDPNRRAVRAGERLRRGRQRTLGIQGWRYRAAPRFGRRCGPAVHNRPGDRTDFDSRKSGGEAEQAARVARGIPVEPLDLVFGPAAAGPEPVEQGRSLVNSDRSEVNSDTQPRLDRGKWTGRKSESQRGLTNQEHGREPAGLAEAIRQHADFFPEGGGEVVSFLDNQDEPFAVSLPTRQKIDQANTGDSRSLHPGWVGQPEFVPDQAVEVCGVVGRSKVYGDPTATDRGLGFESPPEPGFPDPRLAGKQNRTGSRHFGQFSAGLDLRSEST